MEPKTHSKNKWFSNVFKRSKQRVKRSARFLTVSLWKLLRHTPHVSKKIAKTVHHHLAKRPHEYFSRKFPKYNAWHQHKHHAKVHYSILGVYIVAVLVVSILSTRSVFALTTYNQTDWSGGVGASTVNQYSSASSVDVATSGQVSIIGTSGWSSTYSAWSRRKAQTITNSGSAQTDYQVRLSITYDSDMQADFDDLRFANSAGTALPYWIQTKTDSTSAVVWVKVDSLGASGNTNIYMYYGKSDAAAASDGSTTFLLFDDFPSGTLDTGKWTSLGSGGTISISSGELQMTGSTGWARGLAAVQTFTRSDLAIEMKYRWTSNNASYDAFMMGWHDSGSGASYVDLPYAYYNAGDGACSSACPVNVYEDGNNRSPISGSWTVNQQYLVRIQMKASGGATYQQSTDAGANWTTSYDTTYSTESNLRPGFAMYDGTHMIDDVRVRKAVTGTEPTSSSGSEQNRYTSSGTLTSNIVDTSTGSDWGTLTYTSSTPANTSVAVKVRAGNSADLSDATAFAGCSATASGADLSGGCSLDNKRYVQYEITLTTSDGANTPSISDLNIPYSASDIIAPTTNASALAMLRTAGGASVSSNGWTNGASPYFSWTAGADDGGGSGIKGYCLYLGADNTANPATSKGLLGTSPVDTGGVCQFAVNGTNINLATSGYLGTALTSSNSAYYLNIKAIDNGNNLFAGSSAQFHFRFDNTPPTNSDFISAPSQFVSSKDVTLTWPTSGGSAASDANSGIAGLQYKVGSAGTWYGAGHSGAQDDTDLLDNDGSYTTVDPIDYDELEEGNNIVYFRTYDTAGSPSTAHVSTVIKLNTTSPSAPQNVAATPSTNTSNSFAFSWIAPASFQGSAGSITYCYTVNTAPTVNNCTFTAAGATSLSAGAYATQPGDNTFYLVAKDEAGNINYATAASATFTANTSAPGIPLSMEIADVSNKTTSSWKLALSWNTPEDIGAGVSSYKVYRSTNGSTYSQVASTAGTSYVDTGLTQVTYYYKVKACDSANNCGAYSSAVTKLPTGRFTSPPELVTAPSVTVSTRTARIVWATDRTSDSRIQIGTASGEYQGTEAASSEQTRNHSIDLNNLTAGTTYFYKAKWTDEDGNIGTSSELSFTTLPAPAIKDVSIRRVALSSATIQFTATDATKVKLLYGKSDGLGGLEEINTALSESQYAVELAGLDDGTKYFYKINTIDADGNEYDSGRIDAFSTPARPRISNLRFQPVAGEPTSTQMVTWDTNVPSTSLVRFGTVGTPSRESTSSKLTTEHSVQINALKDDSEYSLVAESRDADGNLAISDNQIFKTALDTRPPLVSGLRIETSIRGVGTEARGQIIVSWKTDEPTTSQVAYGEGSSGTNYSSTSAEDGTLTTEHTVIISDLSTSQVYHVQALSKDSSNNTGKSEDKSAIVGKASDSVIDIILGTLEKIFGL